MTCTPVSYTHLDVYKRQEEKYYAIELPELPQDAQAGSVLCITDEGELRVDEEATKRRQQDPKAKHGGKKQ